MKVVCINNYGCLNLTKDRIYDVIIFNDSWYLIINDDGDRLWYFKEQFKLLSEIRNEKINKLLR
jgi:hypothetical protein